MAPADAAMYWASRFAANDQFLLFAFDASTAASPQSLVAQVRRSAAAVADLHLAVESVPSDLDFPRWVPAAVRDDAVVVRPGPYDWAGVLGEIAGVPRLWGRELWRVHVFDGVSGVHGAGGPARVAVLQISHALGDGRRASAIARALFGGEFPGTARDAPVSVDTGMLAALRGAILIGPQVMRATVLGVGAWTASDHRRVAAPVPLTRGNTDPGATRELRTLTMPVAAAKAGGRSVTAGVLAGIADILPGFLDAPARDACAEVTVAFADRPEAQVLARNRFQTAGVNLHADERDRARRAGLIGDELAAARRRIDSAALVASRRAAGAAPAVLAAVAVRLGADAPPPAAVSGWTVVSSVNRGPADLTFAGGRVLLTAGFPALSCVHSLTHGVHGIGDTVTVSVCAGGTIATDVDRYMTLLEQRFR
ncbi:hypothetical protein [Gordonia sp. MP11Mi]